VGKQVLTKERHDFAIDARQHAAIESGRVIQQIADEAGTASAATLS
jgi:hypothetical protein